MKNIILYSLLVLLSFGCVKENFEQSFSDLGTAQTDIGGNQFYIQGSLDGEPFEIRHGNGTERNISSFSFWFDPPFHQHSFSTNFYKYTLDARESTIINIDITRDSTTTLEEVLTVGEYNWFDGEFSTVLINGELIYKPSVGEIYHSRFLFSGEDYTPINADPFNKFELTAFEKLPPSDEYLLAGSSYDGNLYKITGKFQSKLIAPDESEVELIVDNFTAFILDKEQ